MLSWGHCTDESHYEFLLAALWSLEFRSEYLKWPLAYSTYNIFYNMDYVLQYVFNIPTPVIIHTKISHHLRISLIYVMCTMLQHSCL